MDTKVALKKYFGYDNFRNNQEEIINCALAGNDTLVLMPTGGGKSICYQIPALLSKGTAIVVSPLISLMRDQVEALRANGIVAEALNSTNDVTTDTIIRRKCAAGDIKLLYISPERLITEMSGLIQNMRVSLFAIDEAHCISQWGHDFRPEYSQLSVIHDNFPNTPIMALTATADKTTQTDIVKQLHLRQPKIFISSYDRPNLSLEVKRGYSTSEKLRFIITFIKARPMESGIIYCLSRKTTESLATQLRKAGIKAAPYHAGLPQNERDTTQEDFKQDNTRIVCATVAFGMGIDKSNVRWIIHYNMPKSIECFYQEIGRAGRDGAPAETILFYSLADIIQLKSFAEDSPQKETILYKLNRMREYAESDVCRRRILLNYFGEITDSDCGNCDACKNPPQRFDGTRYTQMALSAIKRTDERIRTNTAVEILRGVTSPTVVRNRYNGLPTFGVGKDVSTADWNDYLLQMYQLGFIEIDYTKGNIAKITPVGYDVLFGRKTAQLHKTTRVTPHVATTRKTKLHLEIPTFASAVLPPNDTEDKKLFEALRALRKACADSEGFPPYIIFSDKTLHALATIKPTTIDELAQIPGIGEHKQKKYGEKFVAAISFYVDHF